jgi:hypothetical protein
MNQKLSERINKIIPRIKSKEFLESKGLGNEIAIYIFDYSPEYELEMRSQIEFIIKQVGKKHSHIKIAHVNLFKLIIDYLKNRGLLDRALSLQKEKGDKALYKALSGPLNEEKIAKEFIQATQPESHDIIFMSGIGNAWPILRSHTLLNNLHPHMQGKPLVVFYPGVYDGQGLSLFGKLKDNNYYRAFQLVP